MNKHENADKDMLDPDVRFLLANERTLLAWVRTALAVIAGGLIFTQFGERTNGQITFGILLIAFGALMSVVGYARYEKADKAIRGGNLPFKGYGPALQIVGVVAFASAIIVIELIHLS